MNTHESLPEGATVVRWALTPERYVRVGRPTEWRETWGPGPWEGEPDLVEWRAPGSSIPRMIIRNNFGALCGYAGVPPGHALHGKSWDDDEYQALDVHGGPTYGAECGGHICHVPRPGEPEHVWWFGFDCAHSGDMAPGLRMGKVFEWETYKDLGYVIRETERLAAQLEGAGGQ